MAKAFKLTLLLLWVLTLASYADEFSFKAGAGVNHAADSALYSLGIGNYFKNSKFLYRTDIGFWTESNERNRRGLYGSFLLGYRLGSLQGFNASLKAGVAVISGIDRVLSSPFQFTEEASLGYSKFSVGIKHISNAGLRMPNLGRDYLFFQYIIWD